MTVSRLTYTDLNISFTPGTETIPSISQIGVVITSLYKQMYSEYGVMSLYNINDANIADDVLELWKGIILDRASNIVETWAMKTNLNEDEEYIMPEIGYTENDIRLINQLKGWNYGFARIDGINEDRSIQLTHLIRFLTQLDGRYYYEDMFNDFYRSTAIWDKKYWFDLEEDYSLKRIYPTYELRTYTCKVYYDNPNFATKLNSVMESVDSYSNSTTDFELKIIDAENDVGYKSDSSTHEITEKETDAYMGLLNDGSYGNAMGVMLNLIPGLTYNDDIYLYLYNIDMNIHVNNAYMYLDVGEIFYNSPMPVDDWDVGQYILYYSPKYSGNPSNSAISGYNPFKLSLIASDYYPDSNDMYGEWIIYNATDSITTEEKNYAVSTDYDINITNWDRLPYFKLDVTIPSNYPTSTKVTYIGTGIDENGTYLEYSILARWD